VFHTGLLVNSMSLSGILGELIVDEANNVVSDGGEEDVGHLNLGKDFLFVFVVEN